MKCRQKFDKTRDKIDVQPKLHQNSRKFQMKTHLSVQKTFFLRVKTAFTYEPSTK